MLHDSMDGANGRGEVRVAGTLIEYRPDSQILLATDISVALDLIKSFG